MFFTKPVSPASPVSNTETYHDKPVELGKVVQLSTADIKPNPDQPRRVFDDYELSQLAVSIRQNGLLQPITVRKTDSGYVLISGERRLRAIKLLKSDTVPAIVIETTDEESAVLAALENIQRAQLNYIEEAQAFKLLIDAYSLTQEECAAKLGLAQSTVANKLKLLRLTDDERTLVLDYRLSERQTRAILKLPFDKRVAAIEQISRDGLNTRQTDKLIEEMLVDKPKKPRKTAFIVRHVRMYVNTFDQTLAAMKDAGIPCEAEVSKSEKLIEYKIKIPINSVFDDL
ncbi:MAG: ParB/RepB/Spo0J family partition protein [Oscillospiraceae bacterium]|jgi:ParB family chromosome partitioning protein|nr:ParB/RepB/Spo0J family partition protein [Oscillospiraceae bacterium]